MRVIDILERSPRGFLSHTLCYLSVNRTGNSAFNGIERPLFILGPGQREGIPEKGIGFVLSKNAAKAGYFLSHGEDVLCRIAEGIPLLRLFVEQGGFVSVSRNADMLRPIPTGILTVSDKGSRGEREDLSGPALARRLQSLGAVIEATATVPDEIEEIAKTLKEWSDGRGLKLILSTGGTGFSCRDITPEALASIAQKQAPGIGETMRSASMKITPKAMLSRSCAVIRGETLIVALPGSEKAAEECFTAIAPALRHGVEILCGWDSECGSRPHQHHHKRNR